MKFRTLDEIQAVASGRWLEILTAICPALTDAVERVGRHVACPIHGGASDFRICRKKGPETGLSYCSCGTRNGFQLLQELNGWSFLQAKDAVSDFLGLTAVDPVLVAERVAVSLAEVKRLRELREAEAAERDEQLARQLNRMWTGSIPIADRRAALARKYFMQRGLDPSVIGKNIRFNPGVAFKGEDDKTENFYPAIICRVFDNLGRPVTLHRIYLDHKTAGKLQVDKPKRMMPVSPIRETWPGRVIPVVPLGGARIMGVAEGVETALAAQHGYGVPTWACVSSGPLRSFQPPPQIDCLIAFADRDISNAGMEAALALGENLKSSGWRGSYHIALPPYDPPAGKKGVDWADVWYDHGSLGFAEAIKTA